MSLVVQLLILLTVLRIAAAFPETVLKFIDPLSFPPIAIAVTPFTSAEGKALSLEPLV